MALGVLDWTPEVFWGATMHEFVAAVDGRRAMSAEMRGGQDAATREDHEAMKERFGG